MPKKGADFMKNKICDILIIGAGPAGLTAAIYDCTCGGMQIVTAAGEGAIVAMRASAYVRRKQR
jgi:thioredoxin reductase